MPIEKLGADGFVATGSSIELVRLVSLRSRLTLEVAGIGFGMPTAPAVRALLGSKTRSKAKLLAELSAHIGRVAPALSR